MDALPERLDYGELKLAEIVTLLAFCQNKTDENKILTLFYKRTSSKFYDRCSKVVGKLYKGDPESKAITEDVFQESMVIICEKLKTYKTKPEWTEEECERTILFWMSRFANFLLLKKRKDKKRISKG